MITTFGMPGPTDAMHGLRGADQDWGHGLNGPTRDWAWSDLILIVRSNFETLDHDLRQGLI